MPFLVMLAVAFLVAALVTLSISTVVRVFRPSRDCWSGRSVGWNRIVDYLWRRRREQYPVDDHPGDHSSQYTGGYGASVVMLPIFDHYRVIPVVTVPKSMVAAAVPPAPGICGSG